MGLALPLLVLMQWPGSATASFTVSRFAGADRYDTAKQVAEAAYPGGSATVLLASGLNFPDALAAAYLAGNENVPILLTDPNTASASALAAMSDLKTKNVTILGGSDAVSTIVEQTLDGTASTSSQGGNLVVTRIAGVDRYDTAAKIATTGGAVGQIGGQPAAIVSTGLNFPDAISGGPAAFAKHLPLLLTDPSTESTTTESALQSLGIKQIVLLGGTNAVSAAVATQLSANGSRTVTRLAGADRTDTAGKVYEYGLTNFGFSPNSIFLANGTTFPAPDALAGAPLAGKAPTGILLTSNLDTLGTFTTTELQNHSGTLSSGTILGGTAAVSSNGQAAFQSAASGSSSTSGPITLQSTTVAAGAALNGTVASPATVKTLQASGCGLSNTAVTFGSASGAFSLTIPASQPGGTCTLTFTVTYNNGTATATPQFTISVTSTTAGLSAPTLTGVTVTRDQPPTAVDNATFSFDQTVGGQVPAASDFELFRESGAVAVGIGSPTQTANGWTVNFPPGSADNVTLGAVNAHAVTNASGQGNFPGSVSTTGATTNPTLTLEPDLASVTGIVQGTGTFSAAFNFDKQIATFADGTFCVPANPPVDANWNMIQSNGAEFHASPSVAAAPSEVTGTITAGQTCPSASTVRVTFPGTAASLNLVAGAVKQAAVKVASNPAGDTVGNPMQSVNLPNSLQSSYPVLVPSQEEPGTSPNTDVDFIFQGTPPTTGLAAANFMLVEGDGTTPHAQAAPTKSPRNASALTGIFTSDQVAHAVGVAVAQGGLGVSFPDSSASLNGAGSPKGGQVVMPQLTAVSVSTAITGGGLLGGGGTTVSFTFDSRVTGGFSNADFQLYRTDGTAIGGSSANSTVSNDTVTFSGGWTAAQLSGVVAGGVDRTVTAGGTNHNPPPFPDASFEAVVDGHLGGTTAAPTTSTSTTTTLPLGL